MLKIKSNNANLHSILNKNPNTNNGLDLKNLTKGVVPNQYDVEYFNIGDVLNDISPTIGAVIKLKK